MSFTSKIGSLASRAYGWSAARAVDQYFEYTTLLLPGNGTNGAQNNTFLDGSTNNFTITRNGNTTQGTFSPFSQTGWGNYFDGTGDYLTVPDNTAFDLGSGDFTFETWIFPTAAGTTGQFLISQWGSANYGYAIRLVSSGSALTGIEFNYSQTGAVITTRTYSQTIPLNAWSHIALVRASGTTTAYFNGAAVGTSSDNVTIYNSTATVHIAANPDGGINQTVFGYLSNLRLVKGTAVYTSAFTPPTAPLTAISGTSLLTCQSNRFIDNSTNNFTLTVNGNTSVVAFSPFNPTASWNAATYGGSGYFDGSGDYLSAPASNSFGFGTGDFTIEMWIYPTAIASSDVGLWYVDQTGGLVISLLPTTGYLEIGTRLTSYDLQSTYKPTLNAWTHVVCSRVSGTGYIFANGQQVATGSLSSKNYLTTVTGSSVTAGNFGNNPAGSAYFQGYISGLRVVKGSGVTSVTVPTVPPTAITNTSLLVNFTNAGINDATSKNDLETVGNAQISTTQSKWGGSSMYFDGSNDYLVSPYSTLLDYGSGNATIEFWMRPSSTAAAYQGVIGKPDISVSRKGWAVFQNGTTIRLFVDSGSETVTTSSCLTLNTWTYIAIVKSGTTWTVYADGVNVGSGTAASYVDAVKGIAIGEMNSAVGWNSTFSYTGYIQDLRITKGYARYTSNFTPPTAPFPTL